MRTGVSARSSRRGRLSAWAAFLLLMFATLLPPLPVAHAQSALPGASNGPAPEAVLEKSRESIARWTRVIERVEEQLKNEDLQPGALQQLRDTAGDLQKNLTEHRPELVTEVARIRKLIDALGPAPKEGEPPESDDVASKREQLNKRLAKADGALKQLDLLVEKAKGALAAVGRAESIALGNRLLSRTPSLLAAETWSKSAKNVGIISKRARDELSRWWTSSQVRDSVDSGFIAVIVSSSLLAALLAWFLRRWLIAHFGRDPMRQEPTYRMRVRAALAEATARTAIPIVVTLATIGILRAEGLLFGFTEQIALGIAWAVIVLSVLYGLPRSMLSPALPQWRLARMGTRTARLWYGYALTLAIVVAFDVMLLVPAAELRPSPQLQATYNFLFGLAYALIFLFAALDTRLWRIDDEDDPGAESLARSKWWTLARIVTGVIAVAIPATALARYGILSDFIARRMLATAGAFLIALILHGLARDLVAVFTNTTRHRASSGEQISPLYVWTVLLLDVGLILTMAFLIVPLWGGQWTSLFDQLGWSLTGFKIGEHVFSLTDVLAGLMAFIIVIVIVRSFQHFMTRRVFQQMRMDSGVRDSLSTAIGYVGLVIATIAAIATAGIDLSGLALVAGALSVGVGFGLQSIVNNFLSGLILLAERPIKVGDWVQAGGHEGIVQRISVRSTEIKTFSRASASGPQVAKNSM